MSREVIIRIRDDLDPEQLADKTVDFAYNGTHYEIDLTAAHADEFETDLARYLQAARIVEPEVAPKRKRKHSETGKIAKRAPSFDQRARIREWARETGFHVAETGLIAKRIITAYGETHPDDPIRPDTWCMPRKKKRSKGAESVVAQNGAEQTAMELLDDSYQRKGAALARERAVESGRFGLPKELRDKIRLWAVGHSLDQSVKGQLKTEVVEAYFTAHPGDRPA